MHASLGYCSSGRCHNARAIAAMGVGDLIGSFEIDLLTVYYRPDHELYRTWVGLVDQDEVGDGEPREQALLRHRPRLQQAPLLGQ